MHLQFFEMGNRLIRGMGGWYVRNGDDFQSTKDSNDLYITAFCEILLYETKSV